MKLLAYLGLILLGHVVVVSPEELDMTNENKLSFCSMLKHRRIYNEEKLDDFCSLKVQEWDNQVRPFNFSIVFIATRLCSVWLQ